MFVDSEPQKGQNIKVNITIKWQNDFETSSVFTYYGAAKNEFRITSFGRNFPFREEDNVGDLFILVKKSNEYFEAFLLSLDDEFEQFFTAFGISASQTNRIIDKTALVTPDKLLLNCFNQFIHTLTTDFPPTVQLATNARDCYNSAYGISLAQISANPDKALLKWIEAEYQLFKTIENSRYSERITIPFVSVEELIGFANSILNRRKSRAGKSLEHHLEKMFSLFRLAFDTQATTEDNKKPDFLFPNAAAYHNPAFNQNKLTFLASKTTCKDRWRQILNEADKIKIKHLFTLQQGISKNQLTEMYNNGVCLVVPQPYISTFPAEFRERILTLNSFVNYIQARQ